MRLTALDPRWFTMSGNSGIVFHLGITFLCPHCRVERLAVHFANPIDPDGWLGRVMWATLSRTWHRSGDTFDTLTLTPSIDASGVGHWHGHIVNGEVLPTGKGEGA